MEWTFVIMESVREMLTRIGNVIPQLVGALLILVIGWLLAKLIEALSVKGLKFVRVDTLSEKSGTSSFLAKGGIKYTLAELIGILVYWIIMLIVIITAMNALRLTVAAELLNTVVKYIPNIIAALFISVLGMLVSTLLGTVVRTAASNAGFAQARILSQAVQVVVIIFAVIIALQQLEIQIGIIINIVNIVVAAIGLALGLAFGLGCKDIAGKIVEDFLKKR
jgi:small-conductance mechanosensitive channel